MKTVLIATRNIGKQKEVIAALQNTSFTFVTLNDVGVPSDFDVEETEKTFEGNARKKAAAYGKKTGLLTLSDDSGLEVDALDGRPGVFSARYVRGTDEDRYRALLAELAMVSDDNRGAQFRSVVALWEPVTKRVTTFEGITRGHILRAPRGTGGFGYDPIFSNNDLKKTLAEMTMTEKNTVSHRGRALEKARTFLVRLLQEDNGTSPR